VLAKKKKLSKKQIKEDKLVTGYYEAQKFYEENQTKIFTIVGVLAVVIIAVFWYTSKVEQENKAASTELARVIAIYEAGNYAEAIDGQPGTNINGLRQIVNNYGGSEQGEVARLYLANALYAIGQIDEAYEEFDNFSGSNSILAASAFAGKAACYEVKGQFEDASDNYAKAAKLDETNPQNSDYLLKAAKNAINAENKEDAEDILKTIKKDYKNSTAAREADKYLAYIEA
jgi:TolA-binding protein